MVEEYSDRLNAAMKHARVDTAELARSMGVSYQAVRKAQQGGQFGTDNNIKAAQRLGVSSDWLATGIGERSTPTFAAEPPAAYGMEPILAWEHPDDLPEGDFVMVPRLDVHLSAGGGREQVEIDLVKENPQAFRAEWFREQRLKPGKCAAMRASGDSMERTIFSGDSLLIDTSQTTVVDDCVYALWYDGGERVKRLFRQPGGGLRIVSDNEDKRTYPDIFLKPDELEHVRIIGRVVHKSGRGGL